MMLSAEEPAITPRSHPKTSSSTEESAVRVIPAKAGIQSNERKAYRRICRPRHSRESGNPVERAKSL